jgi:UDP:flavonoid glycosyltransferase YjiC (YdhE family)
MTDACVRRGVALRADDNGPSAAILRAAIDEVMGDHRFADAARAVASEIAAMPPPEQVVPLLEDLGSRGAGPSRGLT